MRLLLLLTLVSTAALADKVKDVRAKRTADVKALLEKAGLTYPVDEVYLRGLKML